MAFEDLLKKWCPPSQPVERRDQNERQTGFDTPDRRGEGLPVLIQRQETSEGAMLIISTRGEVDLAQLLQDPRILMDLLDAEAELRSAEQNPMLEKVYYPLNGASPIPLLSLIRNFHASPEALMMRLGIMLFRISKRGSGTDDELEFIRSALFALKNSGIREEDFCTEGKSKIALLKDMVREYEERKGGPSWEADV